MEPIDFALDDLRSQKNPNFRGTVNKYGVDRTTLTRRFKGEQGTREEFRERMSLLNNEQERVLIDEINRLADRGTYATIEMVNRFASDLSKREPGKNWAAQWCQSHSDELRSVYLKGFDQSRKRADSWVEVNKYFELVCTPSRLIYCC